MADTKKVFLGFKQVTSASFAEVTDKAGYLWFVRDAETGLGDIYFGTRHYGSYDPSVATDLAALKEAVNGILADIGYDEENNLAFAEALAGETTLVGAINKLVELIEDKDVNYSGENAISVADHVVTLAINADDKVLSQDANGLLSHLSLAIDAEADAEGKRYIKLLGKDSADLGKIDVAEFVKDSMVSGAEIVVEEGVTYLVLSFNSEDVADVKLDVSTLIDAYLAGDGLVLEGKTFKVSLVESESKANYLVLEDSKLGVFEMGADVTKTTEEILIAGGPLADEAKSVFGDSIPSGKTVQDILLALFCKEEWPTSLSTSVATLKSSVAAPTITMSTSTVEVGATVSYSVDNGASNYSATPAKAEAFTYGYSSANNNTKEFNATVASAPVTNVAIVNEATSLSVTSTGNEAQSANGTNVAGSATISGSIIAIKGSNTVSASNTSATYSGSCAGLPEYWACSNIKKTSDVYKTNAVAEQTFEETASVSNSKSSSFTGDYKYYVGYADAVPTSTDEIKALTTYTGFIGTSKTLTGGGTLPAGKTMCIAVDSSKSLNSILNGFDLESKASFADTTVDYVLANNDTVTYKVYYFTSAADWKYKTIVLK